MTAFNKLFLSFLFFAGMAAGLIRAAALEQPDEPKYPDQAYLIKNIIKPMMQKVNIPHLTISFGTGYAAYVDLKTGEHTIILPKNPLTDGYNEPMFIAAFSHELTHVLKDDSRKFTNLEKQKNYLYTQSMLLIPTLTIPLLLFHEQFKMEPKTAAALSTSIIGGLAAIPIVFSDIIVPQRRRKIEMETDLLAAHLFPEHQVAKGLIALHQNDQQKKLAQRMKDLKEIENCRSYEITKRWKTWRYTVSKINEDGDSIEGLRKHPTNAFRIHRLREAEKNAIDQTLQTF